LETWNLHFIGCVPEGAFLSFLPELSSLTQFCVSWFAFYLCFRVANESSRTEALRILRCSKKFRDARFCVDNFRLRDLDFVCSVCVYQKLKERWKNTQITIVNGPIVAGQLERGKGYGQYILSAKIVKTVLKSRFYTISPNFNNFTRF
jgi:hypothetical protein